MKTMKISLRKLWMLPAMAGMLFFTACNKDNTETPQPTGPSLTVSTTPAADGNGVVNVTSGDTLKITASVTAPGGFNVVRVESGTSSFEQNRNDLGLSAGATSAEANFNIQLNGEGTTKFLVTAVDDNSLTDTTSITVNIQKGTNSFSGVLLNPVSADGSTQSFYSTSSGQIYSVNDVNATTDPVSATLDFGYYYGNTDMASLASPSAFPSAVYDLSAEGWGQYNATSFHSTSLTASQFNETSAVADIQAAYDGGSDMGNVASQLSKDQVIAFMTDSRKDGGSKVGLLHITGIYGTFNNTDSITFDVTVEK